MGACRQVLGIHPLASESPNTDGGGWRPAVNDAGPLASQDASPDAPGLIGDGSLPMAAADARPDSAATCPTAPPGSLPIPMPTTVTPFGSPEDDLLAALTTIGDDVVMVFTFKGGIAVGGFEHVLTGWPDANGLGTRDVGVARVAADGTVRWATQLGGRGSDDVWTVAADGDVVYVGGAFEGSADFGGGHSLASRGGQDGFLVALDARDGHGTWANRIGAAGDDAVYGVAVDPVSHAVVATGVFTGLENFGLSENKTAPADGNGFAAVYEATGTPRYVRTFAGTFSIGVRTLVLGNGHALVTGVYQGSVALQPDRFTTLPGDPGDASSLFVTAFNLSDGTAVDGWDRALGGPAADTVGHLTADTSGNVYLSGSFTDQGTFGGGTLQAAGATDAFVVSFTPAGGHRWSKAFGGSGFDFGDALVALPEPDGRIVVGGTFATSARFGAYDLAGAADQGWLAWLSPCDGSVVGLYGFGGAGDDGVSTLASDAQGRLRGGGVFSGDVTFAPGLSAAAKKLDFALLTFKSGR